MEKRVIDLVVDKDPTIFKNIQDAEKYAKEQKYKTDIRYFKQRKYPGKKGDFYAWV